MKKNIWFIVLIFAMALCVNACASKNVDIHQNDEADNAVESKDSAQIDAKEDIAASKTEEQEFDDYAVKIVKDMLKSVNKYTADDDIDMSNAMRIYSLDMPELVKYVYFVDVNKEDFGELTTAYNINVTDKKEYTSSWMFYPADTLASSAEVMKLKEYYDNGKEFVLYNYNSELYLHSDSEDYNISKDMPCENQLADCGYKMYTLKDKFKIELD
ncbi:MAG: hypothetical protein IJM37_00605 [Lachnospiraceae bacterium]|nr:hypothetical protein [Lachnospiraceae bacterium]